MDGQHRKQLDDAQMAVLAPRERVLLGLDD
jgi:hypothetical protein